MQMQSKNIISACNSGISQITGGKMLKHSEIGNFRLDILF